MLSDEWVRAQREKLRDDIVNHDWGELDMTGGELMEVINRRFGDEAIKDAKG